ncbi:MAG: hypothetical protein ABSF50_15410 [Burkholderiaceae bacterium]|jgi:hypothetical protein
MKSLLMGLSIPVVWIVYEIWAKQTKTVRRDDGVTGAPGLGESDVRRDLRQLREEIENLVFTTKILCGLLSLVLLGLLLISLKVD